MKIDLFILILIIGSCISAEKFEITNPRNNNLVGSGHFDIKWTSISNAKNYQLYVNDQLIDTITKTTYDYYTTKVQKYTAYIQADLTNGEKRSTQKITFFITKKGLAVNGNMGKNLDPLSMNMGWYYTWSPTSPFFYKDNNYKYIEFVPMIWSTYNEDDNLQTVQAGNFVYLLGYNEPDLDDQSNIPYQTAAENWPKFKGKSRYLGSPVPALSPTWTAGKWLNDFMGAVDQSTVDFVALHCYYSNYGGKEAAQAFLTDVVDGTYKLFHKPIWITEFAVSGWSYNDEEKRKLVEDFMREAIKGLNEREYVERYAWFSFNTEDNDNGASAMWTESTGVLTTLGEIYVSEGNPDGYDHSLSTAPDVEIRSFERENVAYEDSISVGDKTYQNLLRKSGVSASASSSVNDQSLPEKAVDNSIETRWESAWSDQQEFTIDLGSVCYLKQFDVMWQWAAASTYSIEVSNDGESYTSIASVLALSPVERRSETFVLNRMVECRYVRIKCVKRASTYGYSIWEIAVYGSDEPENPDDSIDQIKSESSENTVITDDSINSENSVTTDFSIEEASSGSSLNAGGSDGIENPDDVENSGVQDDGNNPDDSSGKGKSKLSSGAIAAIVIVVIVVVAAAIAVPIILIRRSRMNDSEPEITAPDDV